MADLASIKNGCRAAGIVIAVIEALSDDGEQHALLAIGTWNPRFLLLRGIPFKSHDISGVGSLFRPCFLVRDGSL